MKNAHKPYEVRFTVTDWAWFAGVLAFIVGGLAIGLALIETAVTP